ncbi:DUF3572 family protein [Paracoccus salsus]|uniref:DUF3572 family protein n=1 Tax=Paracoccus salsus TaxID=2911061 RepID=UPI001F3FA91D|nr:DUF3572 family protein [Paracoccus salsus]MCF3974579.1 DUF3572 domain-containing protein [Paracoccus salsus]
MAGRIDAARELAGAGLIYILERPELAATFLGGSGLRAQDIRALSGTPELGLHVLDFLLEDDGRVLDAAEALQIRPQDLMSARVVIAGPGNYGWELG